MRRVLAGLFISTACFGQVSVVYTGRMFGYLRFPDRQTPAMTQCDSDPSHMPDAAKGFYAVLQSQRNGVPALTVGMGDNFGPDLFARPFDGYPLHTPPDQQIPHPGKDLFVWNFLTKAWVPDADVPGDLQREIELHRGVVPADNVGCFIRAAGYVAIVPGKHRAHDLSAQTRYLDKLALSLVLPLVGNFSFKPEVDFFYYRNKVENLPFHSVTDSATFSYTFDWRQGQPFSRALRYPTPPPSGSVPSSGR